MSEELEKQAELITVPSSRFGDLEVPADSVIEFPGGIIGFPSAKSFIMLEHKPPFSWLQSTQDPDLAFVVVDGFEFGQQFWVRFATIEQQPHGIYLHGNRLRNINQIIKANFDSFRHQFFFNFNFQFIIIFISIISFYFSTYL